MRKSSSTLPKWFQDNNPTPYTPVHSHMHEHDEDSIVSSESLLGRIMKNWRFDLKRRHFASAWNSATFKTRVGVVTTAVIFMVIFISVLSINIAPFSHTSSRPKEIHSLQTSTASISSENQLCSQIGSNILKTLNGTAVDAIIAAAICIGVTNSYSSGIGGGGFLLIRTPHDSSGLRKNTQVIDFRETAPAGAHRDMYKENPRDSIFGGLAVGVPGEIRGFEDAHKLYGKVEWKELFTESIKLCKEGWRVNRILERRIAAVHDVVLNNTDFREVFAPDGIPLKEGDWIKREALGDTLQAIANHGSEVFYEGWIAESLVHAIQKNNGIVTMEDMKNYKSRFVDAVEGYYRGLRVITTPPPSSGPVLLSALNILEGYDMKKSGRSVLSFHRIIEALKFAFAQRSFYGDPFDEDFSNITTIMHSFLDKNRASAVRHNISDSSTFDIKHYEPFFDIHETHGTMHISVVDQTGMAASMTSTVNLLFGAQIMDPKTGIILNDEMDDFSVPGRPNYFGLKPSPYNFIRAGKRPLSSSVPTIIERDTELEMVVGASGGSRIITSTLQTIVNILDFEMTGLNAVNDPRYHHQLVPNLVMVEHEFSETLEKDLKEFGHEFLRMSEGVYVTGVSVVRRFQNGTLEAVSDHRKAGGVAGY